MEAENSTPQLCAHDQNTMKPIVIIEAQLLKSICMFVVVLVTKAAPKTALEFLCLSYVFISFIFSAF